MRQWHNAPFQRAGVRVTGPHAPIRRLERGEEPHLTGEMASVFVRGLQGDDPKYLKVAACTKYFAVHSGPEALRHEFNAE